MSNIYAEKNVAIRRLTSAWPYRTTLSAILVVCQLCSCSLTPEYSKPDLPVPKNYPVDISSSNKPLEKQKIVKAAQIGWRDYFADTQLQHLIEQAIQNNRDLRLAALRVEEARAIFRIQRADQLPTIGAGVNASRSRTPGDLNPMGIPTTSSQYQVGVNMLSWEIDFWGRVRSLKEAALEEFLATHAAQRALTISIVTQVANGYFALKEMDERISLAKQTIQSRQESFRIFKRRYEVGATSKLELAQVEVLLMQARMLATQLEQARDEQAHALTQLVGAEIHFTRTENHFDDNSFLQTLHAGLPSDLLLQRPDIEAAEHRLKSANANIGAARAAFFPRVTLIGAFGTASAELDGLFHPGSKSWNFAPSISMPIFDSGRNIAGLELASVRRDQAVANYEKTIQTAFREVSDALSAKKWLTDQVAIQKQTLATQAERARLAKLRYEHGAAPYLEVLDAQRDLLTVEQQLVQTRRALLSSQINLYAALGGGTQNFADTTPLSSR